MSETAGSNGDDPTLRHIHEIADSMGANTSADDPYAAVLRAEAAGIIRSLPTRENPITSDNLGDLAKAIGGLAHRILDARILNAIADGYSIPIPPRGAPTQENAGPRERTPGALCSYAASHPLLRDRDIAAQAATRAVDREVDDLNDRALAMRERRNAAFQAMVGVLGLYGVERSNMNFIPSHTAITFQYRDNTVRVSTLDGVTDVTAWDGRLTPEQGDRLQGDHDDLVKQGAHLAHLNHFLQKGAVPPQLTHVARQIEADQGSISAAFEQHAADVRAHALSGGFRRFQVHARNLRYGLPVALHILEQSHDAAYDMIGDYSATNGFIQVDQPGRFTLARRQGPTWEIGERDGIIRHAE